MNNILTGIILTSDISGLGAASQPIIDLINSILSPLIAIVGALGAIWCVLLGVKLAKADEPQEREKAKGALKNAIVGYLLIFILVVVLRLTIGPLTTWMNSASNTTTTTSELMLPEDEAAV